MGQQLELHFWYVVQMVDESLQKIVIVVDVAGVVAADEIDAVVECRQNMVECLRKEVKHESVELALILVIHGVIQKIMMIYLKRMMKLIEAVKNCQNPSKKSDLNKGRMGILHLQSKVQGKIPYHHRVRNLYMPRISFERQRMLELQ